MNDKLQEGYYIGLTEKVSTVYLDDQKIGYTSKAIAKEVINDVAKNKYFKGKSKDNIIKLISKKIIVPLYSQKSNFKIFAGKILFEMLENYIMGFCTVGKNSRNIFFYTNKLSGILGKINAYKMWKIISHEMMHYLAAEQFHGFFGDSKIKNDCILWYTTFIKNYFNVDYNKSLSLAKNWFRMVHVNENRNTRAKAAALKAREKLYKYFDKYIPMYSNEKNKSLLYSKIEVFKFIGDFSIGYNTEASYGISSELIDLLLSLCYVSYKEVIGNKVWDVNTFPGQEFIWPSEIIAISYSNVVSEGNRILSKLVKGV